jgi:hypothetical protein
MFQHLDETDIFVSVRTDSGCKLSHEFRDSVRVMIPNYELDTEILWQCACDYTELWIRHWNFVTAHVLIPNYESDTEILWQCACDDIELWVRHWNFVTVRMWWYRIRNPTLKFCDSVHVTTPSYESDTEILWQYAWWYRIRNQTLKFCDSVHVMIPNYKWDTDILWQCACDDTELWTRHWNFVTLCMWWYRILNQTLKFCDSVHVMIPNYEWGTEIPVVYNTYRGDICWLQSVSLRLHVPTREVLDGFKWNLIRTLYSWRLPRIWTL